jgi:tetratricopeptide (TPR) repeat protein
MPAHIYSRVGRWHDAVLANQVAIQADDAYLDLCRGNTGGVYPLGYVPHNHHFLWFAASMEGDSATAREAAVHTAERTADAKLMREPGFEAMQHYWMTPWFDNVRFGRWEVIAASPNPAPDLPYVSVIWHYAEGIAAARLGRGEDARQHLQAMRPLAAHADLARMMVWDRYPLSHAARIAERSLTAEVALLDKDTDAAIAALREAVEIEDAIPYDEPPGWHAPTRHALGAVLLAAGKADEAETVYRAELERNPQNGWSLTGLAQSLRALKRNDEAAKVETEFEQSWQHADVKLTASRI